MPAAPQVDFGRAITFTFQDERDRMKIVIICLLYFFSIFTITCLVGLLGFALIWGYQRRVALQTMTGADTPMPEFDRWGEDLTEGLKILAIRFLYALPGAALLVGGYIFFVVAAVTSNTPDPPPAVIIIFLVMFLGGFPLMILGQLLGVLGTIRFIDTGEIGSAFRFGEIYRFTRDNFVNLLLTTLVGFASGMVAQMVGLLLLLIGSYFTPGWSYLVTGHAFGQVLRAHRIRTATDASAHFE